MKNLIITKSIKMKKLVCMLLLIQTGFVMAQKETFFTVNGKRVQINTNINNGLSDTEAGEIQLGGDLLKPTVITTTPVNTLTIGGLQTGTSTDNVLVADANGVLKWVTREQFGGDNLGNHEAGRDLDMKTFNINNIGSARIKNEAAFFDRGNSLNLNTFNFYKSNGVFYLWNGAKNNNIISIDETINETNFNSRISLTGGDVPKILFLGANNLESSRIEHFREYNLGMIAGTKTIPGTGQFSWLNYTGAGGAQIELMRLSEAGNLGIGTNAPANKLHIKAAADPVKLEGLQAGSATDNIVVADANGVLKTMKSSNVSNFKDIKIINSNYTVTNTDYTIIASQLSDDITITLPDAASSKGRTLLISQTDVTNSAGAEVTVKFNVPVIYSDTFSASEIAAPYYSATGGTLKITLQSDQNKWHVVSSL